MQNDRVLVGRRPCGGLVEIFFSGDPGDVAVAKGVCGTCDVATQCLSTAVERQEWAGVWGGQLFRDGVIVPVARRRGRPVKAA